MKSNPPYLPTGHLPITADPLLSDRVHLACDLGANAAAPVDCGSMGVTGSMFFS